MARTAKVSPIRKVSSKQAAAWRTVEQQRLLEYISELRHDLMSYKEERNRSNARVMQLEAMNASMYSSQSRQAVANAEYSESQYTAPRLDAYRLGMFIAKEVGMDDYQSIHEGWLVGWIDRQTKANRLHPVKVGVVKVYDANYALQLFLAQTEDFDQADQG